MSSCKPQSSRRKIKRRQPRIRTIKRMATRMTQHTRIVLRFCSDLLLYRRQLCLIRCSTRISERKLRVSKKKKYGKKARLIDKVL